MVVTVQLVIFMDSTDVERRTGRVLQRGFDKVEHGSEINTGLLLFIF